MILSLATNNALRAQTLKRAFKLERLVANDAPFDTRSSAHSGNFLCISFAISTAISVGLALQPAAISVLFERDVAEISIKRGNFEQRLCMKACTLHTCYRQRYGVDFVVSLALFGLGTRARCPSTGTSLNIAFCWCPSTNLGTGH